MTSVSERLQTFENANGTSQEANATAPKPARAARAIGRSRRTSPKPKSTVAGTYSSRRRNRSRDNRIDLSDHAMDMTKNTEPESAQQQEEQLEAATPPSLTSQISEGRPSLPPPGLVDLELVKSMSTRKLQTKSLALTKDEIKRKAEQEVKEAKTITATNEEDVAAETRHSKWAMLRHRLWKDPLAEEKKRQEEIMLQHMKETDSAFSEEDYQIKKHTQDIFITTKKEEAETVRSQRAERDSKLRIPIWEKIIQTTLAVFISKVEAEKRQQEHVMMSHLREMDASVDEDDFRRQKEAQELFVTMKRRELERQRFIEMEQVEKQRREAMLAENMRLPDGLQNGENASLMMQSSLILQGAKIQEALRSSLFQSANFSEGDDGEEGEAAAARAPRPIPLHIQKQLQQAILLQEAMENPDVEIDQEALRHSQEIQESLIFYAKQNRRTSWLDAFMTPADDAAKHRASIPQEVSFDEDDAGSMESRISWLSGGFGGSWRSSFSNRSSSAGKVASSPPRGKAAAAAASGKKDQGKNGGLRNSWHLRGNNHTNNNLGKEANLHLAGHAEESESANSDL
ncbi:MAG: hypothetical protein SGBAC_002199 [Bacillariaceae sp.]